MVAGTHQNSRQVALLRYLHPMVCQRAIAGVDHTAGNAHKLLIICTEQCRIRSLVGHLMRDKLDHFRFQRYAIITDDKASSYLAHRRLWLRLRLPEDCLIRMVRAFTAPSSLACNLQHHPDEALCALCCKVLDIVLFLLEHVALGFNP